MLTENAIKFREAFAAGARQLAGYDFPDQWVAVADRRAEAGQPITGENAARWANLGFTPSEAEAEILRDITPEDVEDAEDQRSRRPRAHIWRRDGTRII